MCRARHVQDRFQGLQAKKWQRAEASSIYSKPKEKRLQRSMFARWRWKKEEARRRRHGKTS